MKNETLSNLCARAINQNDGTSKSSLDILPVDYIIRPKVERVTMVFTAPQITIIHAVVQHYLRMLEADDEAPIKFVELVGNLTYIFGKSNFHVKYGFKAQDYSIDTNEFHVIEKALRICCEAYRARKEGIPEPVLKLQKHFTEGKPL